MSRQGCARLVGPGACQAAAARTPQMARPVVMQLKRVVPAAALQGSSYLSPVRHIRLVSSSTKLGARHKPKATSSAPLAPLEQLRLAMRGPIQEKLPPLLSEALEEVVFAVGPPDPTRRVYSQVGSRPRSLVSTLPLTDALVTGVPLSTARIRR